MSARKIKYHLKAIWLKISNPFKKTYTANLCGHKTKLEDKMTSDNGKSIMSMPLSENGKPDYCIDCISRMSIKCAWCGERIGIGHPVTLYIPNEPFNIPEHAVRYDKDERCLVGCMGWNCADSGIDRQGFWHPGPDGKGRVFRVASILETMMQPGNEGKCGFISDLSDPNSKVELI